MELTKAEVFNFADDNTLSAFAKSTDELKRILDDAAVEAIKWLDANQMIANADKFKSIIVKKPSMKIDDFNITVGNQEIKPSSSVKLLGVDIDNKLNFRKHIKTLCRKAGAKLNAIKRLGSYLKEKDRKLLVTAHVTSQFNYSSIVWHFGGLTEVHKMEKLHERCIRYIYNEYNKNYFDLLYENDLTTLFGKRTREMCCETYKTIHGLNAAYMKDIFEDRPSKYPSRNENELFIPKFNQITYGYKSYRVQGPKIWNLLPQEIKGIQSYNIFKSKLRNIDMPFCSCQTCLTLQTQTCKTSTLANKMLQDILINK